MTETREHRRREAIRCLIRGQRGRSFDDHWRVVWSNYCDVFASEDEMRAAMNAAMFVRVSR